MLASCFAHVSSVLPFAFSVMVVLHILCLSLADGRQEDAAEEEEGALLDFVSCWHFSLSAVGGRLVGSLVVGRMCCFCFSVVMT